MRADPPDMEEPALRCWTRSATMIQIVLYMTGCHRRSESTAHADERMLPLTHHGLLYKSFVRLLAGELRPSSVS
jgi:hypothetical protein